MPEVNNIAVTPAMAKEWLTRNKRNRNISRAVVNAYKRDMSTNAWHFTGDLIRFDTHDRLIDGQHRLTALSELPANTFIPFLVGTGFPPETQRYLDQGRKRSAGQQLGMAGFKDANTVAAGIRQHILWDTGLMFRDNGSKAVTAVQVQEWAERGQEHINILAGFFHHIKGSDAQPSAAYAAALTFSMLDLDGAADFFRLLRVGTAEGHPLNALDRRLRSFKRNRQKVEAREQIGLFFATWDAYCHDKTVTLLKLPPGQKYRLKTFPGLYDPATGSCIEPGSNVADRYFAQWTEVAA